MMSANLFLFERNQQKPNYYPIVFNTNYDISFMGLEGIHSFDTKKWGKIHRLIENYLNEEQGNFSTITPLGEISKEELRVHHTSNFLKEIHESNSKMAVTAEIFLLRFLPNIVLQHRLLEPFKWQVSGSILAAHQAFLHGSAVNLGGGFHHASATTSGGFCFFADIGLIIRYFWQNIDQNLKFFIIDLDAHQGNGHEFDKFLMLPSEKDQVYILDIYNSDIYPNDKVAKTQINCQIEINSKTSNEIYIQTLKENMIAVNGKISHFKPDLIIYNAGTDILVGDPLGLLQVTELGVIERDEFIFSFAKANEIPVVMLLSGGYQKKNAEVISKSIINLIEKKLIVPVKEDSNTISPRR